MSLKGWAAQLLARRVYRQTQRWAQDPVKSQERVLKYLLQAAAQTAFGKDHGFAGIQGVADFQKAVPLHDYEELRP